ncbi:hypothetical protein WG68_03690 [Arsukibacterium ikkense]|uniref:Multimeric flavodoxin domain-containing protein n=1 Tax=Arsukibacterium ikkense TaxID=336831 RepID=A0A0M2V8V4_9GAMM|nr:glycosyltransferase [Arsukibacterium ikkense]KKO47041.1 hypothetical protein WG68_03690 [Arsukibacterium ikkense]
MTGLNSKCKDIIFIDCHTVEATNGLSDREHTDDNILRIQCDADAYIEPLMSALRTHYQKFKTVSLVTNNVTVHHELTQFFPELFRTTELIDKQSLSQTDVTELKSTTLPHFRIQLTEPVVSVEFEQLKRFFMLDERLTDVSESELIQQLTDAFISKLSGQQCAFSVFVQIRLLSFYSAKLNKYGDAYFKSLSTKCGDSNVSIGQLWQLISDNRYTENERFFIYNQVLSMEFSGVLKDKSDFNTRFNAYRGVLEQFAAQLGTLGPFIDQTQRNPDIIFVFIGQFLSPSHAPSKIALEIVKSLCVSAKKQVVLIDTCELLPAAGALPWYDAAYGNRGQYNAETLTYEGAHFNYLQLSAGMPNLAEIAGIIDLTKKYKPYFSITVGESITADICNHLIPNIVIPTVAVLSHTISQFRILGEGYSIDGFKPENYHPDLNKGIIQGNVLASVTPPERKVTREELGLPPDKFIFALVGNRLDLEVSESFLDLILSSFDDDMFLVFIGDFKRYSVLSEHLPMLKKSSITLGYQRDLASVIDLVDVYINPERVGGGTSALYALSLGVPVVSYNSGDVFAICGDYFSVADDDEYKARMVHLKNDRDFYMMQKLQAIEMFKLKSDSGSILKLISQVVSNDLFNRCQDFS